MDYVLKNKLIINIMNQFTLNIITKIEEFIKNNLQNLGFPSVRSLIPYSVYIVYNNYNHSYYVEHTQNGFLRLDWHFNSLEKGIHENSEMQKDYIFIKEVLKTDPKEFFRIVPIEPFTLLYMVNPDFIAELNSTYYELEIICTAYLIALDKNVYNNRNSSLFSDMRNKFGTTTPNLDQFKNISFDKS